MRIMRLAGLIVISVFAFVAMTANASAGLPEFLGGGACDLSAIRPPTSIGPYPSEVECLRAANFSSGDWWWLPVGFTSTSGASSLAAGRSKINCTKDTSEGETTSVETIGKVLFAFTGCKLEAFFECKSKGAKAEEIMTAKLKGTLGYINKSTKLVGVKLEPESGSEYTEGEIECAGVKGKVTGSVIGDITPTNTKATTGTLTLTRSGTKQGAELIEIEGKDETGVKLKFSLDGGVAEEAAEETSDTITFKQEVELMA